MNILQINSSARAAAHSTALADGLVAGLRADHPDAKVVVRDVGRQAPAALDEAALQALFTPADQRTPEQAARVALDEALIAEIQAADTLVLAVPMYNFGVPAGLKNWIDAVAKAGVTFRYTEKGPIGLLSGKKVYVALTRGGVYRGTPADSQVPYLQQTLGFLGMTDVHFVYAEGLNLGPDAERKGLADAREQIAEVLAA